MEWFLENYIGDGWRGGVWVLRHQVTVELKEREGECSTLACTPRWEGPGGSGEGGSEAGRTLSRSMEQRWSQHC